MTESKWPNFTIEELTCRCGCGQMKMQDKFMQLLVTVRRDFGLPMYVSSGYRCPEYNNEVSRTGFYGPHTTGCAVDVMISRQRAHAMCVVAFALGMEGIGWRQKGANRFVHLDAFTGLKPRPTVWSY